MFSEPQGVNSIINGIDITTVTTLHTKTERLTSSYAAHPTKINVLLY